MKRLVSPLTLLTIVFVGQFVLAIVLYVGRDTFGGFELTPNPDRELIENAPVMPAIDVDTPEGAALARLLGPERLADGRYFVVDPLGNLILSYPADADQGRLLEDLERLLNVSRIG
ncbi:MAG TPA: hypothetical protein VMR74_12500 [Gammaproteobacteria bacterium]|nr:hypothetical protein [Gammaproteobacteria bacterium]